MVRYLLQPRWGELIRGYVVVVMLPNVPFIRWGCLTAMLLCASAGVRAGHQYDVWQFAYYAGLDFRSGVPVSASAPFYTDEGSSMWCNPLTGALQFSTDGRVVYRANGTTMPNGVGLRGGPSSSSSALIVPFPSESFDAPTQFYVFCIGDQSWVDSVAEDSSLTVNTVDFSVDSLGVVSQVNTVLADGLAEKVVATHHCDGSSFWVVVHARSKPIFFAYKVTSKGIEPPVVSRVGRQLVPRAKLVRGGAYGQGLMTFSASGKKLAMAVPFSYSTEVFDFDNGTGVVSNPVVVDSVSRTYGVCFSPGGRMLYTVEWIPGNMGRPPVRQFDLQSLPTPTIVGKLETDGYDFHLGGIQLGPDGHIWLAESHGLARITSPEIQGAGCGFVSSAVRLSPPARIVCGLPNLITSFLDSDSRSVCAPPIAHFDFDSLVCSGGCITPTDQTINEPVQWLWTFDGGVPETFTGRQPPSICYSNPGVYQIHLITSNSFGSDTASATIRVAPLPMVSAGPDVMLCDSVAGTLHASGAEHYEWEYSPGMAQKDVADPTIRVFSNTQFVVRGWNSDGCSATDTVWAFAFPEGRPPMTLHTPSISGLAGGLGTVVVLNSGSKPAGSPIVELHLPASAYADPVLERGTLLTSSRPSLEELVLEIQPQDATSDTLCLVKGTFLLTSQPHRMWAVGVSQDSCDSFISEPGQISTNTCGGNVRMVLLTGEEPKLTIGQSDNSVNVHAPRDMDLTLECWDSSGEQLMHHAFQQRDEMVSFSLPSIHGVLLLLLRFDYGTVTKVVLLP